MRLNLGCGTRKFPGWVNVDKMAACNPDQIVDLERLPWPWADNAIDEILMSHVLEHLGATPDAYLAIIKELYRVCRNGARVTVVVPHPRHDYFLGDPTHVRAIIPEQFDLFSQTLNRQWIAQGVGNTPLGIYLGVDFAVQSLRKSFDEPWRGRLERGEISAEDLERAARTYINVVTQVQIVMTAIKPAGQPAQ